MKTCWFCGTEAIVPGKLGRKDGCSKCRMSLKCCRNCRHFDPPAPRQCREPAAEFVGDKEGANFCEYFEFVEKAGGSRGNPQAEAKRKFDALFNDKK
jgi:hypothetical protein